MEKEARINPDLESLINKKLACQTIDSDNIEQILSHVFVDVLNSVGWGERSVILNIINKRRTQLNQSLDADKARITNSANQIDPANLANAAIFFDRLDLYEDFRKRLIEAQNDPTKAAFFNILTELDKIGIGLDDINSYCQAIYGNDHKIFSPLPFRDPAHSFTFSHRKYHKNHLFVSILGEHLDDVKSIIQTNPALLYEKDCNNSSCLNYLAYLPNKEITKYKKIFEIAGIDSDEKIAEFIKTSRARVVSGLSYSTQSFSGLFGYDYADLMSIMVDDTTKIKTQNKDIIKSALGAITSNREVSLKSNPDFSKLKVVAAPYPTHAAYFIIKYDKENQPTKISYCDGNLIHDRKSGEVEFEIDREKLKSIGSIEGFLKNNFKEVYENKNLGVSGIRQNFNEQISKLVKVDDKGPKICERKIPAKPQNRGNCSYKSMNLATRAIMQEIDRSLDFNKGGSGYELFKEYKKAISSESVNHLLNVGESKDFSQNANKDQIISDLKPLFLQSVKKGHAEIAKRSFKILEENGVDFKEVRAQNSGNMNIAELTQYWQSKLQESSNVFKFGRNNDDEGSAKMKRSLEIVADLAKMQNEPNSIIVPTGHNFVANASSQGASITVH